MGSSYNCMVRNRDGPTIFLITFSGIFPVILNTIAGVKNISKDYYNAARSMGAGPGAYLVI